MSEETEQGLDFSMVIASTVHDMKNSLATLTQAHSQWQAKLSVQQRDTSEHGIIDYEFAHLNAIGLSREQLVVRVVEEGGQLKITINDDGPVYPAYLIERQTDYVQGINQGSGSTGLGLYFAAHIARLHVRNGMRGRIEIANGGVLGGAMFSMTLP